MILTDHIRASSHLPIRVMSLIVAWYIQSMCAYQHACTSFYVIFDKVHNPLRLPRKTTSERPKVLRTLQFFEIFTCKCASHHNGVHFFISHLTTWLRTRRFSEPTSRPSGATNHWKNTVFRDFPVFSRTCIFFLLTLSLLLFFLLIFLFSLPLPTSAFPCVHIVGSLTSKFPSNEDRYACSLSLAFDF